MKIKSKFSNGAEILAPDPRRVAFNTYALIPRENKSA